LKNRQQEEEGIDGNWMESKMPKMEKSVRTKSQTGG